jgi:carbon-monoxide dehydrogenase small subunit
MKQVIVINVNEIDYEVMVNPQDLLINVLRRNLGFTGTKKGCGQGDCGTCTVIIDGKSVLACITMAMACQGKKIQTIEGLDDNGALDPIQQAFLDKGAVQCGFCTPGMIMSAKALLDENPTPTMDEIKRGLSGNLCRCTGYIKIAEAVETAAEVRKSAGKGNE